MSLQQGLSGLNAASRNLDVIGNNIANANTVGAKASRAEFTDIYAASISGSGSTTSAGIGVAVSMVSQSFNQGNITATGNDLDLAINGNGFFQVTLPDGSTAYSRNGEFKLDQNGFIVSNAGSKLMGFPTDTAGVRLSSSPVALQLPTGRPIAPNPTTKISTEINLNAATPTATATTPLTSIGTSLNVYNSQGSAVPVGVYFTKTATPNVWDVYSNDSGGTPAKIGGLEFNTDGSLKNTLDASGASTGLTTLPITITSGAGVVSPQNLNIDFSGSTQMGSAFGVSKLSQDGWAPGQLTGVKIESNGVITARYSNGQTQAAGQVELAGFRNAQGLSPLGGGNWSETMASGQATRGAPGESGLGNLQSGAVEESNVDLTAELVNMMTAQRAYQANAQTIKTQDQIMSTLMNMR